MKSKREFDANSSLFGKLGMTQQRAFFGSWGSTALERNNAAVHKKRMLSTLGDTSSQILSILFISATVTGLGTVTTYEQKRCGLFYGFL